MNASSSTVKRHTRRRESKSIISSAHRNLVASSPLAAIKEVVKNNASRLVALKAEIEELNATSSQLEQLRIEYGELTKDVMARSEAAKNEAATTRIKAAQENLVGVLLFFYKLCFQ